MVLVDLILDLVLVLVLACPALVNITAVNKPKLPRNE